MVVSRITKVSNPRKRKRRMNPRKMSLKQKLMFGTKRVRAAAKAALARKRSNPKRRHTTAKRRVARHTVRRATSNPKRHTTRRHRRRNPGAHILTLGLLNPRPSTGRKTKRRKKNTMAKAKTRRRRTARTNPRRRRRNLTVRITRRRRARASNPHRRRRRSNPRSYARRRHHVRRRNPNIFGHSVTLFEGVKVIAGGLAGVAITKAVPNMLPAGIASSSPFMSTIVSAGVAIGAGMLVNSLVKGDPMLGYAVAFGGLMQAGSVALNAFLPQVGTVIGLQGLGNGMGDIVAGRFPVPQNPIMAGQPMALPAPAVSPAAAHAAAAGVGAIYNPFGRVF